MIILPRQELEVGAIIEHEGKTLVADKLYSQGKQMRGQNIPYAMPVKRGYLGFVDVKE